MRIGPFFTKEFDLEDMFNLKNNKATSLVGLFAEFNQMFWEEVKFDLKEMFDAFHRGALHIERLNHGIIALIPKVVDVDLIHKFMPILY